MCISYCHAHGNMIMIWHEHGSENLIDKGSSIKDVHKDGGGGRAEADTCRH